MMLWYLLLISFDCLRVLGQKNMFVKDIGAAHDASWATTTEHPKDNKNHQTCSLEVWTLRTMQTLGSATRGQCTKQDNLWQRILHATHAVADLSTLDSQFKMLQFSLSLVTLVFGIAGIAVRLCKAVTNGNTRVAGCQCRARPGVQFIDWIKTVFNSILDVCILRAFAISCDQAGQSFS